MAKRIIPNQFKTQLIDSLIESANTIGSADEVYYTFVGDHITTGSTDEDVTTPNQSERSLRIDPFRNMIFGKQLQYENFKSLARRYNWEQDKVYTRYDDLNANLFNEAFFVAVNEEESIHVYKCLDNNNGSPSIFEPTIEGVIGNEDYYETGDGYIWKYMYSIDDTVFELFATEKFIPIIKSVDSRIDKSVLVTPGSIDVVAIDDPGQNYNNYISATLQTDDLIPDNQLEFRLPSTAAIAEGFYANTWMYIDDNQSSAGGQFRRVVNSKIRNGRVVVELETGFTIPPQAGDSYVISPIVDIFGDGTETVQAAARAVINSAASNSIHRVEMLERGRNYSFAIANVREGVSANSTGGTAGPVVDVIPASVRPILPPPGGHASNPAEELGSKAIMIQMEYQNSEGNTVPTENTFAQFGVIKNPQFANVQIDFVKRSDSEDAGADGEFALGETFLQFKKIRLCGAVNLTIMSTSPAQFKVSSDPNEESPEYNRFLNIGDIIYLNNETSPFNNFIARIRGFSIDGREIEFACINNCLPVWEDAPGDFNTRIYLALEIGRGIINDIPFSGRLFANKVSRKLVRNELIIGLSSTAIARVTSINISDRPGANGVFDFFTFVQAVRCRGQATGNPFVRDQIVFQGPSFPAQTTMRARVHSFKQIEASSDFELILTNIEGQINTNQSISAVENSASMIPGFDKYNGDLDPTSGSIIYLQNDVPVERQEDSTEQVRVILEF